MIEYRIPGVGIVAATAGFTLPNQQKIGAGWLLSAIPAELEAIGAEIVTREARPVVDERFYQVNEVETGNEITYPVVTRPIADILAARLADLAAHRYRIETAGIDLGGSVIRTDEGSQAKINGAYNKVQRNPATQIDWKGANGWILLDATQMTAIADAVSDHVQDCYSAERVHSEAMSALAAADDVEGLITYDFTTDWPATASAE